VKNITPANISALFNAYSQLLGAVAQIQGESLPEVSLAIAEDATPLRGDLAIVAGPISRIVSWDVRPDPICGSVKVTWETPDPDPAYEILHRRF